MVPVGLRLHADSFDGDELALDAEQTLDDALVQVLLLLADDADELEAKPLRRAAGAVWRFAGDVVSDVAKGELKRMGGDVAS